MTDEIAVKIVDLLELWWDDGVAGRIWVRNCVKVDLVCTAERRVLRCTIKENVNARDEFLSLTGVHWRSISYWSRERSAQSLMGRSEPRN